MFSWGYDDRSQRTDHQKKTVKRPGQSCTKFRITIIHLDDFLLLPIANARELTVGRLLLLRFLSWNIFVVGVLENITIKLKQYILKNLWTWLKFKQSQGETKNKQTENWMTIEQQNIKNHHLELNLGLQRLDHFLDAVLLGDDTPSGRRGRRPRLHNVDVLVEDLLMFEGLGEGNLKEDTRYC